MFVFHLHLEETAVESNESIMYQHVNFLEQVSESQRCLRECYNVHCSRSHVMLVTVRDSSIAGRLLSDQHLATLCLY